MEALVTSALGSMADAAGASDKPFSSPALTSEAAASAPAELAAGKASPDAVPRGAAAALCPGNSPAAPAAAGGQRSFATALPGRDLALAGRTVALPGRDRLVSAAPDWALPGRWYEPMTSVRARAALLGLALDGRERGAREDSPGSPASASR